MDSLSVLHAEKQEISDGAGVQCLSCGKDIPEPLKLNTGDIQRFCSDKCRWNYHNRKKLDNFMDEIRQSVEAIMKKHGYIR
jgi:hypothetical protein